MTDQTRLNTETAEPVDTDFEYTQRAFVRMASESNRQMMKNEAWKRVFGVDEHFSSDEQIVLGFAGFIMKFVGKKRSPYTWLSKDEAYGLVARLIRDPIKIKNGKAKRITDAKIDAFLSGAVQRGLIEVMRADVRDKRFKWYRLAKGVLPKFEAYLQDCEKIDLVVKAQAEDPDDPCAGEDLLRDESVYFNTLDQQFVDPRATEVPFTKDANGDAVLKENGKVLTRPALSIAALVLAAFIGLGGYVVSAQDAQADMSGALGGPKPKLIQTN